MHKGPQFRYKRNTSSSSVMFSTINKIKVLKMLNEESKATLFNTSVSFTQHLTDIFIPFYMPIYKKILAEAKVMM